MSGAPNWTEREEAIACARAHLERVNRDLEPGAGKKAHQLVLRALRAETATDTGFVYDDDKAAGLIKQARTGDVDAMDVIKAIAVEHIRAGRALPANLRAFTVELLDGTIDPPRRAARHPETFTLRNLQIALAITMLIERGFKSTRNSGTVTDSACSIVAAALEEMGASMTEHAVAKVWSEWKERPIFRDWLREHGV